MTLLEPARVAAASPAAANAVPAVAIRLRGIGKSYKLYRGPREQLLDAVGLYRWLPASRRPVFPEFQALQDIDLTVAKGERVGIVGRNGAGKTTLLKLITGNFAPSRGEIEVNGTVQALMQVGMGFHNDFSGYDNIRGALIYNGLTGDGLERAVADVVDFAELGEFLHQPLRTYSLGMGARLQFAAATAVKPDILIVDEVLGAGDAYFTAKSAVRMRELTSSGCTLLLVSHATAQVLQFCERVIWLHEGRIRMAGPALDVVKAYEQFIADLTHEEQNARQRALPPPTAAARDAVTPAWQKQLLAAAFDLQAQELQSTAVSEGISRWPAEPGLKIVRVEVLDAHRRPAGVVQSGEPMAIEIEILAEMDREFRFQVVILLMTLEGVGIVRHLSAPFCCRMVAGERRRVRLEYERTLLASGEFIFSAALFKFYDPDDGSTAVRYDLLSRSFRFKVLPLSRSEPAIFAHPCRWALTPADGEHVASQ